MNIPAAWRQVIYWIVLVATVIVGVLGGFDLVPEDAISRGAQIVTELVTVIAAVLALKNLTPDDPEH